MNGLYVYLYVYMEIKSDRERQMPYDCAYKWNLKNRTNEQRVKQKSRFIIHKYVQQTGITRGEGGRGAGEISEGKN